MQIVFLVLYELSKTLQYVEITQHFFVRTVSSGISENWNSQFFFS